MRPGFSVFLTIVCCVTVLVFDFWPGLVSVMTYEQGIGGLICGCCMPTIFVMGTVMYITWRLQAKKPSVKPPEKKDS
jgi:hypothetical protein